MNSPMFDTLLQVSVPARAAEPARAPEAPPFGPTLRQALTPDRRPASATQPPPADSPAVHEEADDLESGEDRLPEEQHDETAATDDDPSDVAAGADAADKVDAAADEVNFSDAAAVAGEIAVVKTVEVNGAATALAEGEKCLQPLQTADAAADASAPPATSGQGASASDEAFAAEADTLTQLGQGEKEVDDASSMPTKPRISSRREGVDQHQSAVIESDAKANAASPKVQAEHSETTQATAPTADEALETQEQITPAKSETAGRGDPRSEIDDRTEVKKDAVTRRPDAVALPETVAAPTAETPVAKESAPPDAAAKPTAVAAAISPSGAPRAASALVRLGASRSVQPSTPGAGDSESSPQVDRARFVQRVEGAVRRAHEREGRMQVRLSPPELGTLRIEIAVHQGVLTAKLEAETTAARNLLMDNLPALRERLAQQGIRVEKFDVDVRRDGGGSGGDGSARDSATDHPGWRQNEHRTRSNATRPAAAIARPGRVTETSDARLDIQA